MSTTFARSHSPFSSLPIALPLFVTDLQPSPTAMPSIFGKSGSTAGRAKTRHKSILHEKERSPDHGCLALSVFRLPQTNSSLQHNHSASANPKRALHLMLISLQAACFSVVAQASRDHMDSCALHIHTSDVSPSDEVPYLARVNVTLRNDCRLSAGYALNILRLH